MASINSNIRDNAQPVGRLNVDDQAQVNNAQAIPQQNQPSSDSKTQGVQSETAARPGGRDGVDAAPIVGATTLLAAKYPSYIAEDKDAKSKSETRVVLYIAVIILAVIAYGWTQWGNINFKRTSEFTYNSGLIGGIMMLFVLLYAVRKRVRWLKKLGGIEAWYYFHLIGGIFGPILIVFHSSFQLKSVNSSVALISMVLIVLSGMFGRYIYTRIGYNLHRKLLSIKNTETALIESIRKYQSDKVVIIEKRLSEFSLACLSGPKVFFRLPLKLLAIRAAGANCYVKVSEDLSVMLQQIAQNSGWSVNAYKKLFAAEKQLLRKHINLVVEIAKIHHYERLLVRWRVLHIPLLYILLITGLTHVFAVHMY